MVDVDNIVKKSLEYPVQYEDGMFHIVTVGRLAPEKRLKNAVYCCKRLKDAHYNICWHIIGDGVLYSDLKNLIVTEHLEDSFILEGGQNNPYPFMRNADLYVHTSYFESQGLTILESMALGVPCVVVKSQGPCEFIQDGINGILVEQGIDDLFEKIQSMIRDKSLYLKIKDNTKCPDQFHPSTVMSQIYNAI